MAIFPGLATFVAAGKKGANLERQKIKTPKILKIGDATYATLHARGNVLSGLGHVPFALGVRILVSQIQQNMISNLMMAGREEVVAQSSKKW